MNKPLSWFEIPALDLSRAKAFYERILGVTLQERVMLDTPLAVFPFDRATATGGSLIQGEGFQPSRNGAVVYLNAGASLDAVLERVAAAGGEIVLPKTALPENIGYIAHIADTEGNRIGLHSTGA